VSWYTLRWMTWRASVHMCFMTFTRVYIVENDVAGIKVPPVPRCGACKSKLPRGATPPRPLSPGANTKRPPRRRRGHLHHHRCSILFGCCFGSPGCALRGIAVVVVRLSCLLRLPKATPRRPVPASGRRHEPRQSPLLHERHLPLPRHASAECKEAKVRATIFPTEKNVLSSRTKSP